MEHTTTPWYQLSGDDINITNSVGPHWASPEHYICECKKANAEFIVRACNSHNELLDICEHILRSVDNGEAVLENYDQYSDLNEAIEKATKEA